MKIKVKNACPDCGGRTYTEESHRYYFRWQQCGDCSWRGPLEVIPVDERVDEEQ